MASNSLICAHDNIFNKSILGDDAFYFKSHGDIAKLLSSKEKKDYKHYLIANEEKIKHKYSWERIVHQYLNHFEHILGLNVSQFKPAMKEQEVRAVTKQVKRA
jgi:hypothetical protein